MCGFHFWVNGLILEPALATVPVSQFSCSVSDPWQPCGLQRARLPCPSPSPGACSSSCPSSWWCHPTISSSAIPFSSCLQSFPVSGSFQMRQLFASVGQSTGASASASVFSVNIQGWFPLGLIGLISLQSKEDSQESSSYYMLVYLFTFLSCYDSWIQFYMWDSLHDFKYYE